MSAHSGWINITACEELWISVTVCGGLRRHVPHNKITIRWCWEAHISREHKPRTPYIFKMLGILSAVMTLAPLKGLLHPTLLDFLAGVQPPPKNTSKPSRQSLRGCLHQIRGDTTRCLRCCTTSKMTLSFLPVAGQTLQAQPASYSPAPQYPSLAPPTRIKPARTGKKDRSPRRKPHGDSHRRTIDSLFGTKP